MIDALVQRYGARPVPRYTSYPTAAEFTARIGPSEQARWLQTLDPERSISLYLHIPYCREICHYCGCETKMVLRDDVLVNYTRVLQEEIDRVGRHLTRRRRVSRLHWGGGTPSLMRPERLGSILETLSTHFIFDQGFEHAIEIDPRGVTAKLAERLADLGVNRVSLGVQDLDPDVQLTIGRIQPLSIVSAAFETFQGTGIRHINVDLIYGLPRQTPKSVADTARRVAALGPSRVACYGYAHLPRRKRNQRLIDMASLPDPSERFAQAQAIAAVFAAAGYQPIGIDHFAHPLDALATADREDRLHRNFQGYTDDGSMILLGFGASAISRLEAGFVQNIADPTAYARAVGRGHLPAACGYQFTPGDRIRAAIIERLMCAFRIDLKPFGGAEVFSDELALLRPMIADGIVTSVNGVVAMTAVGRPFVRIVASIFDSFRLDASSGFSLAV